MVNGDASPSGATGFYSADFFYIVPDKCTECKGFHDEPQCAAVCPVDCCVPDPKHVEDVDTLLKRKDYLDGIGQINYLNFRVAFATLNNN